MANPIPYTADSDLPLVLLAGVLVLALLFIFWDDALAWSGLDENADGVPDAVEDLLPG